MHVVNISISNKNNEEYFSNRQTFDSRTLALMYIESLTWKHTTGINFIESGYFETIFKHGYVNFVDKAENKFHASLQETVNA